MLSDCVSCRRSRSVLFTLRGTAVGAFEANPEEWRGGKTGASCQELGWGQGLSTAGCDSAQQLPQPGS